MNKKIVIGFFLVMISLVFAVNVVLAESLLPVPQGSGSAAETVKPTSLPPGTNLGNYKINDLLEVGKKATNWILGMVGSISLLMFIYGGFTLLMSHGEPAKVTEGKKIITTAIIGIIIVFSSYIIVKFVVTDMLGMKWEGGYINPGAVTNTTPICSVMEVYNPTSHKCEGFTP